MGREAIEFHDSVLARIDCSGDQIRLRFEPAFANGEVVKVSGNRAELVVVGVYEFVENFSAD